MDFLSSNLGQKVTMLASDALLKYLKKPHAVTVRRNCVEEFLNNSDSTFVSSIDLDDQWVILILK